jgi:hypothetical protein
MLRSWRNDSILADLIAAGIPVLIGFSLASHNIGNLGTLLQNQKADLYHMEANIIAAILGFMIAAAAIIGSASGIQALRSEQYGLYKRLIGTLTDSMTVALVTVVFDVFATILDPKTSNKVFFACFGLGLFLLVILRIARTVRRLYQALSI